MFELNDIIIPLKILSNNLYGCVNVRACVPACMYVCILNESYNLSPYILAASSDNKSKASTNFSFIQRMDSCQNSLSNFI